MGACPGRPKLSSEEGLGVSLGSKRGEEIAPPWGLCHTGFVDLEKRGFGGRPVEAYSIAQLMKDPKVGLC